MNGRRRLAKLFFAQLAGLFAVLAVLGAGHRDSWAAPARQGGLDVVVVVDTSSRTAAELDHSRQAALSYVRALPPDSHVALVPFGRFPVVQRGLAPVTAELTTAIRGLRAEGASPLLDAVSLAVAQFDPASTRTRIVVVVSDGADEGSRAGADAVRSELQRIDAQLQVLSLKAAGTGTQVLQQLVVATRGDLVVAVDRVAVTALAQRTARHAALSAPVTAEPTGAAKFLESRSAFLAGVAVLFGAATVALLLLTAPRPERVSFDLITAPTPTGARAFVGRLSSAAEEALERRGKRSPLERSLERAGVDLRVGEFLLVAGGASLATAVLTWFVAGPLVGLALGVATALLARTFLRARTRRRQHAFAMQLGDTITLLTGNLRAGHGLLQSLEMIQREAEDPTASEFARLVVETRLGRDIGDALHALADRMQCEDLRWVVPAVEMNREIGGDLARVLDNIGQTIRDRSDLKRQVKTLSAEGRLSAYVLIGLPFALLGFLRMTSPRYVNDLTHGTGLLLTGVAAVLMAIGAGWLLRMCRIEY